MNELFQQAMSLSLLGKCIAAIVGILLIHAGFRALEQTLPRHFGRVDERYRVRKFVIFSGYIAILLFVSILFEDRLGRLSFALGVAGAGVAVALQDVLSSIAGAFSIGFSKLYTVGDRVQIGDTRGDVIDISLLRTTLMEVGSWVGRDLYSGRIVRIPNNAVLKGSVFNYSQGFRFIWDQIKVVLTITSDPALARAMLLRVAKEVIGEYLVEAQNSWNAVSEDYRTENPPLEPVVILAVNAASLEFILNYVVDYTKRTTMQDRLFTKIVDEIAMSNGQLAWASSGVTVINQPRALDPTMTQPSAALPGARQASESR
jgi:small-conductance mechanosensitive channel